MEFPPAVRGRGPVLAVAALLVLALAVRLAIVAATPAYEPAHDDAQYDRLACAIVVTGSYPRAGTSPDRDSCGSAPARDPGPSAFRPPGYPAFLAAVYALAAPLPVERWTAARVAQALLGTALVALVGLLARGLWGRRAGFFALAAGALYLPLAVVGASLLAEILFATLLVGALVAALAARRPPHGLAWVAVAGVLVGLATLTRPNAAVVLFPLAFAVSRVGGRRSLARPALLVALTLATVAPWTIRNAVQMDAFVPVSTHVGEALAGTYNEEARNREDHPGAWLVPSRVAAFRDVYAGGGDQVDRQRELTRRALDYAADHPLYVAEVAARNTQRLLNLEGPAWWRGNAEAMSLPERAGDVAAVVFFPFVLLALAGALAPPGRRLPAWLWATAALLLLSVVVVAGEIRFRAPLDAFVCVLAGAALARAAPLSWLGRRSGG